MFSPPTNSGGTKRDRKAERERETSTAVAKAAGVSRGAVERTAKLDADLKDDVRLGKKKPTQAQKEQKRRELPAKIAALPDGEFRVIYADPPWKYNDERGGLGAGDGQLVDRRTTAADHHYPTMTKAELVALDVKSLRAEDAVLFCWATFPLLPTQLDVVKEWGFKYKTAFVWGKGAGAFGHYHKADAELLLVATRGACTPEKDKKHSQIIRADRGRHSEKPELAREIIDEMYPQGPRIELFNRGGAPEGWAVWGNETAGD